MAAPRCAGHQAEGGQLQLCLLKSKLMDNFTEVKHQMFPSNGMVDTSDQSCHACGAQVDAATGSAVWIHPIDIHLASKVRHTFCVRNCS